MRPFLSSLNIPRRTEKSASPLIEVVHFSFLLSSFLLFFPSSGYSCSCIGRDCDSISAEERIQGYDQVFTGRVMKKERVPLLGYTDTPTTISKDSLSRIDSIPLSPIKRWYCRDGLAPIRGTVHKEEIGDSVMFLCKRKWMVMKYSVKIFGSFKGNFREGDTVSVYSGIPSHGSCGFPFKEGRSYEIYSRFRSRTSFNISNFNMLVPDPYVHTNKCFCTRGLREENVEELRACCD